MLLVFPPLSYLQISVAGIVSTDIRCRLTVKLKPVIRPFGLNIPGKILYPSASSIFFSLISFWYIEGVMPFTFLKARRKLLGEL